MRSIRAAAGRLPFGRIERQDRDPVPLGSGHIDPRQPDTELGPGSRPSERVLLAGRTEKKAPVTRTGA